MTLALSLFGAPTVTFDAMLTALEFERRAQLVAYLALKRTWVSRSELAALLWPDQDTKLAQTNLRKALFRLHALPWGDQIEAQAGALRFEPSTDVLSFETALRERRLADALNGYRGDLLAGFDDDRNDAWWGWLAFERDRLRAAWRGAAQEHLAGDVAAPEAIDLAARLLEADPFDEAALRAYMSWLVRAGQPARARQAYRDYVARLAAELGLVPGSELVAFHDSLVTPAASLAATPKIATAPDDGFVGRTIELRRIAALLSQDDCRLLCVVGPGGVGKTRMVRRVIEELGPSFEDGASFVPLEDIASIDDLGGRLARELGIPLKGGGEVLEQVIEFLQKRQVLLVLDNFEQLATDASILEQLLAACPRLKLVATSRVRLALATEWLLPLDGLPCPEDEDRDRIESFDAARLFVRAAHRVNPALVPTTEAAAIVDICRQVEGLPLALELAAAWTRVLSCDAIAAELRQGVELLRATDSAQPTRHASIDVVFEQSWQLLAAIEREVLARLSVFHGSFSAEAARAVAGAPLPVLAALSDKSLLHKDDTGLRLHPLVQQLAAERLGKGEAGAGARSAHAAYFHRLLQQLKPAVASGERAALRTIDQEFENCRRAWNWSIRHDEADTLARSADTFVHYADSRGRFDECLSLLREAIEAPVAQSAPRLLAFLSSKAAHLMYRLDRYQEAEAEATRALATTKRTRDTATKLQALNVLATCALRLGRLDDARRHFKQALGLASPEYSAHSAAVTLDHLALIEKALGRYDEALRLSMQSLMAHRSLGDSAGEALCLNNLGSLCLTRHEFEAAGIHLREALAICDRDGITSTRAFVLSNLTEVAMRTGDFAAAERHASRGLETANAIGNRAVQSWVKLKMARLALHRGDVADARSTLADALGTVITIGMVSLKFDAVECFAKILQTQGEAACAQRVLAYAIDHPAAAAPVREELRAQLLAISETVPELPVWPDIDLDDLIRRIVVEEKLAHAPLIAALRTGSTPVVPAVA